jgi:hypothetical protein
MAGLFRMGRGLNRIKEQRGNTYYSNADNKRFFIRKDETGRVPLLLIDGINVSDLPFCYEHGIYSKRHQRATKGVFLPCTDLTEDGDPQHCQGCNEMLQLPKNVWRRMHIPLTVITLAIVTDNEGRQWSHTKKLLVLGKPEANMLADEIHRITTSPQWGRNTRPGMVRGVRILISRRGEKSPSTGNHIVADAVYSEEALQKWFAGSPRVQWYLEKIKRSTDRVITREEAAKEYFAPYNLDEMMEPTRNKLLRFKACIAAMKDDMAVPGDAAPVYSQPGFQNYAEETSSFGYGDTYNSPKQPVVYPQTPVPGDTYNSPKQPVVYPQTPVPSYIPQETTAPSVPAYVPQTGGVMPYTPASVSGGGGYTPIITAETVSVSHSSSPIVTHPQGQNPVTHEKPQVIEQPPPQVVAGMSPDSVVPGAEINVEAPFATAADAFGTITDIEEDGLDDYEDEEKETETDD